jgi:predicted site-specific integrase-resolvase
MEEYLAGKKASKILGVHQKTLYRWEENGYIETIRTPGGKRLYNVKKYLEKNDQIKNRGTIAENIKTRNYKDNEISRSLEEIYKLEIKINDKKKIIYGRVSTQQQKEDLDRQINMLKKLYPDYELITDIGSGVNLNRKELRRIIDMAIMGKIKEVVVVHKDRLCRFGYELIEDIIKKYSNGKITIISGQKDKEPQEELVEDVLQIMNIFVAKMNGLRKYNKI